MAQEKYNHLREIIGQMGSMLVAYSGGVDSTLLLKVGIDVLGDRALAVTASSETYPIAEIAEAEATARALGGRFVTISTKELDNTSFAMNGPDRCYHCKMELFRTLKQLAAGAGLQWVAHGANKDDENDYRPGNRAATELGVRAPLQEAGLTKAEIRELSRKLGLPTWDKPSLACLASRIPYGVPITRDTLLQIGKAEEALKELGLRQVRVRHHGSVARIETELEALTQLIEPGTRERIVKALKKLGYLYVALDMEGYRSGSMNTVLQTGKT